MDQIHSQFEVIRSTFQLLPKMTGDIEAFLLNLPYNVEICKKIAELNGADNIHTTCMCHLNYSR